MGARGAPPAHGARGGVCRCNVPLVEDAAVARAHHGVVAVALGYVAGRMKRYRIKVFPGDRVRIELSSYDLTRGRIVYRMS